MFVNIIRILFLSQDFGILTTHEIPQTSSFPVFTRSGEVLVSIVQVSDSLKDPSLKLDKKQLETISHFHHFTFSQVLRLEKYPINFDPEKAKSSYFIVPLLKTGLLHKIDWTFLKKIADSKDVKLDVPTDDDRKKFRFSRTKFEDAVVMPWYRNRDQPQVSSLFIFTNPNIY